ncbi:hypothetical protein LPMP_331330 [Leishmania panamensis]|uniref:Uncharacterized protein n=1 Tax=Leishmania panamensis TaxID=5679 RepID=A0A088S1I9_LEIPA|nr:hypothetical protein LPMP_331330 [Leishmania panamensis]AIO01425.1 hypothetical protein LPMP_331330 [Leishmania panamensis]
MDIAPSSSCALRKRLWGLFNIYSTVMPSSNGVCELAEARRLEVPRYRSCLDALARLSSFRNLFLGSEDDMAIRAASTQLQSRLIQEMLWEEAVRLDVDCARQQRRLGPLEVQRSTAPWLSNDLDADRDVFGRALYSSAACSHGGDSTPNEDAGAADDVKGSISWNALYSVVVLYLYDQHCFHRSFLAPQVDALRSGHNEAKTMHTGGLDGAYVKVKQIHVAAMAPLVRRKTTYASRATPAGATQAAEQRPCDGATTSTFSLWYVNPSFSSQGTQSQQPTLKNAVGQHVEEEHAGRSLKPVCTPPRPPRQNPPQASPVAPSLRSPVPTQHLTHIVDASARAGSSSRYMVGCTEDSAKPVPPPRCKHTQREAAELSCKERHIGVGTDVEVINGPQPVFYPAVSVSMSSSSNPAPPGAIAIVLKRTAVEDRRQWLASPSPRPLEGAAEVFGDEPGAIEAAPAVVRIRKLRPQSPSQQNAMVTHQTHKHRTRHSDAAALKPATENTKAPAQRLYATRRPQAANPANLANATPKLTTQKSGADTGATAQKMCSCVSCPLDSRSGLAEAWPGRSEYSCDLTPPSTIPCEVCLCEVRGGSSSLDIGLERERTGEQSGSSGDAEGRHTTAFAVGALRGASVEASNGRDLMRPDWVRGTSPAKPSPSPDTPPALFMAPVAPSCASSASTRDVEDAANDQENQLPPTQTSRRRGPLHHIAQTFPLTTGEPFAPHSLNQRHQTGTVASPGMVIPVWHATAPSPTPSPHEDETEA